MALGVSLNRLIARMGIGLTTHTIAQMLQGVEAVVGVALMLRSDGELG